MSNNDEPLGVKVLDMLRDMHEQPCTPESDQADELINFIFATGNPNPMPLDKMERRYLTALEENQFLKRCRELADKTPQLTPTIHTSPGYKKLLKHAESLQAQIDDYEHDAEIFKARIQRLTATIEVFKQDLVDGVTGD